MSAIFNGAIVDGTHQAHLPTTRDESYSTLCEEFTELFCIGEIRLVNII